jgi:hypothetical protein
VIVMRESAPRQGQSRHGWSGRRDQFGVGE